jgi:uncharacterized protein YigA (DUF484 family)
MTPKDFFTLTARMREAQKDHDRQQTQHALRIKLMIERDIDAEIERVRKIEQEKLNPKLFK